MRWSDEVGPEEIAAQHMADADIVICEGFKQSALPKIEIHRREAHPSSLLGSDVVDASTYRAMVTDDDRLAAPVPIFRIDTDNWLNRLADFVETRILTDGGFR
jgi:molybdopterin-guanine dinucleotide biosynthesis protein